MTQDFDPPLPISVCEFRPTSQDDLQTPIFPTEDVGEGHRVETQQLESPPVIPFAPQAHWEVFAKSLHTQIKIWLDNIETDHEIGWHNTLFPEEYGQPWARSVVQDVCGFYHHVIARACKVLDLSLKTTVIVYMIGHVFYIPLDRLPQAYANLTTIKRDPPKNKYVCPRYVDRFLKVMLYPILSKHLRETFKRLQQLFALQREPSDLVRDRSVS